MSVICDTSKAPSDATQYWSRTTWRVPVFLNACSAVCDSAFDWKGPAQVGAAVGAAVGVAVGAMVGAAEGVYEGRALGNADGSRVGTSDGDEDGTSEGASDGLSEVADGRLDGELEGTPVGPTEGVELGAMGDKRNTQSASNWVRGDHYTNRGQKRERRTV